MQFDWNFKTDDYSPFNDTVFTVSGGTTSKLVDVISIQPNREKSGTFSYIFPTAGKYTVGLAILDEGDATEDSYLSVDNFRLIGSSNSLASAFTPSSFNIPVSNITQLTYDPGYNNNSSPFADFKFKVIDSVGVSSPVSTFTINVDPVNDIPVIDANDTFDLVELDSILTASGAMTVLDYDNPDTLSVSLISVEVNGNPFNVSGLPASLAVNSFNSLKNMFSLSTIAPDTIDALPADPPDGSSFYWNFTSGSSDIE